MNEWLIAALALVVARIPAGAVAFRARPTSGLVALQVAGSNATLILLLLSQGFDRQPFVDLALTMGVMSFIGSPRARRRDRARGEMSMRGVVATVLLVAGRGAQVLACLGVARMRWALDRLHYTGLSMLAVVSIALAILVANGF